MSARRSTPSEASDVEESEVLEGVEEVAEEPVAEPEPVAAYEALVVDLPEESEQPEAPPEETAPEPPEGYVAVRYMGAADALEYGEYVFRPGQPVFVPSDVAEEVLTTPFETFETV